MSPVQVAMNIRDAPIRHWPIIGASLIKMVVLGLPLRSISSFNTESSTAPPD